MRSGLVLALIAGVATTTPGCRSLGHTKSSIREALIGHRQAEIDVFSRDFLSGAMGIEPAWLGDERAVSIYMPLPDEGGGIVHLGVDRISDYFLCLLEARERTSTGEILARVAPHLVTGCAPGRCDVCFTSTYSLDPPIRSALVQYWRGKERSLRVRRSK